MEIRFIDILTWIALCFLFVMITSSCIRERIIYTGDPEVIELIMECRGLKEDFARSEGDFIDCQQTLESALNYIGELRIGP